MPLKRELTPLNLICYNRNIEGLIVMGLKCIVFKECFIYVVRELKILRGLNYYGKNKRSLYRSGHATGLY